MFDINKHHPQPTPAERNASIMVWRPAEESQTLSIFVVMNHSANDFQQIIGHISLTWITTYSSGT